jgi:hypothetical protein
MKRRAATWEQMSQLAARVAAAEARNEEQVAEIRRGLQHRLQDQELVRQQMREKMELEHQLDLARLRSGWAGPEPGPTATRAPHSLRRATQAYAQAASSNAPHQGR